MLGLLCFPVLQPLHDIETLDILLDQRVLEMGICPLYTGRPGALGARHMVGGKRMNRDMYYH